jgi:hypothetical protein
MCRSGKAPRKVANDIEVETHQAMGACLSAATEGTAELDGNVIKSANFSKRESPAPDASDLPVQVGSLPGFKVASRGGV